MLSTPNAPVRAVMFDFDGTLVDTMDGFADVAGRLISEAHGWSFADARAAYLRTSGIPFFQQLEVLFPGDERNPGLVEAFEFGKLHCYDGRTVDPDVPALLAGLRARGIAAVVSSNNYGAVVDEFLAGQAVTFDLVLGYRDNFAKGEEHFAFAEQQLGIARPALVFVGDSLRDGQIALGAGVRFVARLSTNGAENFEAVFGPKPFPMVQRLTELLDVIDAGVAAGPAAPRAGEDIQ